MNREMRRAQAKADKKQEQARDRVKAQRIMKREARRQRSQNKPKKKPIPNTPEGRKKLPGRFSSILTIFVTTFIILQAVVPVSGDQNPTFTLVVNLMYYLMFGYFMVLWLSRSQFKNALYITIGTGIALSLGLLGIQYYLPEPITPNFQIAMMGSGAVVIGAFLGNLVFTRAP